MKKYIVRAYGDCEFEVNAANSEQALKMTREDLRNASAEDFVNYIDIEEMEVCNESK